MGDQGEWLSTQQTAELLGVTARTVYRMIDDGEINAYRMGRVIRMRRDEILEYRRGKGGRDDGPT